jgi:hypothetical protein
MVPPIVTDHFEEKYRVVRGAASCATAVGYNPQYVATSTRRTALSWLCLTTVQQQQPKLLITTTLKTTLKTTNSLLHSHPTLTIQPQLLQTQPKQPNPNAFAVTVNTEHTG